MVGYEKAASHASIAGKYMGNALLRYTSLTSRSMFLGTDSGYIPRVGAYDCARPVLQYSTACEDLCDQVTRPSMTRVRKCGRVSWGLGCRVSGAQTSLLVFVVRPPKAKRKDGLRCLREAVSNKYHVKAYGKSERKTLTTQLAMVQYEKLEVIGEFR